MNAARSCEFAWPNIDTEKVQELRQLLAKHSDPTVRKLARLVHTRLTRAELTALIVPLERKWPQRTMDADLLASVARSGQGEPIAVDLIVENLRSSFNVGSILRTADCLGIRHVYLTGYSATPEHPQVRKAAMASDDMVEWSHHHHTRDVIAKLRNDGIRICGLESGCQGTSLFDYQWRLPTAVVLGNERWGIAPETLGLVDDVVEIPLFGEKNSLNVSCALAAAGYQLRRAWQMF